MYSHSLFLLLSLLYLFFLPLASATISLSLPEGAVANQPTRVKWTRTSAGDPSPFYLIASPIAVYTAAMVVPTAESGEATVMFKQDGFTNLMANIKPIQVIDGPSAQVGVNVEAAPPPGPSQTPAPSPPPQSPTLAASPTTSIESSDGNGNPTKGSGSGGNADNDISNSGSVNTQTKNNLAGETSAGTGIVPSSASSLSAGAISDTSQPKSGPTAVKGEDNIPISTHSTGEGMPSSDAPGFPPISSSSIPAPIPTSSLSKTPLIVGVVIGMLVFLLLLFAAFLVYRRRRRISRTTEFYRERMVRPRRISDFLRRKPLPPTPRASTISSIPIHWPRDPEMTMTSSTGISMPPDLETDSDVGSQISESSVSTSHTQFAAVSPGQWPANGFDNAYPYPRIIMTAPSPPQTLVALPGLQTPSPHSSLAPSLGHSGQSRR